MKTVPHIAFASAPLGRVHRDHERFATGFFHARHKVAGEAAIFVDVELEPNRPARSSQNIFDGCR